MTYNDSICDVLVNSLDRYLIFAISLGAVLFSVNLFIKEVIGSHRKNEDFLAELLEANTEFRRLNYMVSHDLRGPLRQMVSFSDLALLANKSQDSAEVKENVELIGNSAKRLYTLTEDLLSLARLDNDNLTIERFQLADIVQQLSARFHPKKDPIDLQLEIDDISLEGNPTLIGVVLQNLIENGIKYNKSSPKKITVSANKVNQQIEISVRDNGIGIPAGQEQEIFKMRTRLPHQQAYQGSGIDLAIAKKIVEVHRGVIRAIPQDQGTLFIITLPSRLGETAREVALKKKEKRLLQRVSRQQRILH